MRAQAQGRLIAVVGPSGVGKDSVMTAMAKTEPRIRLARRVITRPADAGGEIFDAVSVAEFKSQCDRGGFSLWWSAHGLYYGIPAQVQDVLATGQDVLANLSRSILLEAQDRFATLAVISLEARPEVLRDRLISRNREDAAEIARRLVRASCAVPPEISALKLDNSGPLDDTVRQALALLYPVPTQGCAAINDRPD